MEMALRPADFFVFQPVCVFDGAALRCFLVSFFVALLVFFNKRWDAGGQICVCVGLFA